MIIEAQDLKKSFGKKQAIKGVSFEIPAGQRVGLLGPNGAGKTTTINMMLGLLRPTSGDVTLFGESARKLSDAAKAKVGYVPQDMAFFPELSGIDNVNYWARLYGIPKKGRKQAVREALEFTELWDRRKDAAKTYSGGMQRRLNISCGIVHKPKLLFLDEPTVGVDPQSRNHILESARRLADTGTSIVYTSHYMEEIQTLCERVIIIDEGQVVADGKLDAVVREHAPHSHMVLDFNDDNAALAAEKKLSGSGLVETGGLERAETSITLRKTADFDFAEFTKRVLELDLDVTSIREDKPTLEHVFLNLTGKTLRD